MRKLLFVLVNLSLMVSAIVVVRAKPISKLQSRQRASDARAATARIVEAYGRLPLSFEANRGQTDGEVKFLSRGGGYSLFLTATEAVMELRDRRAQADSPQRSPRTQRNENSVISVSSVVNSREAAVLRMKLVGANASARIKGADELPGKSNYFIGNDPSKWRTSVPTYAKVRYENVYSGIDLVYYGNQQQLEYDFVVAPGADPHAIRLAFPVSNPSRDSDGAVPLHLDGQGDLVLGAEGSELRLHRPVVYQEISGARQSVAGNFVIQGERQVGFEVARYDASKPLIIDPVLSYSTYLGGSGNDDSGYGIAVDSSGNAYVTGQASSTNFPTANAFQSAYGGGAIDTFVTKLNAGGSAVVYSTYLGGRSGDSGHGIAVDSSGNAYVTGTTTSTNFPTANAFQATYGGSFNGDAFVTKLNTAGNALVYSTYLGGNASDQGNGIAVDSSGNAYVTGFTVSTNFPTANALQPAFGSGTCFNGPCADAFVAKLNASGSALVYSTYLGGNSRDEGEGIAVDSSGNVYVTGITDSTDFPTTNSLQAAYGGGNGDVFVTKLNAAGSALVYSTYLGGSDTDYGTGIAVDSSGNAYVTGGTCSNNFPRANGFQAVYGDHCDAFVTKLNAAGSAMVYSTYLGGSGGDQGNGIAVDSSGNAYVTGTTTSANFPTANAFQVAFGGSGINSIGDAFVTKLNAVGSALVYSTYLGGSGDDGGNGIAVDSSGSAYVTGTTTSANFPTANAFQTAYGGGGNSDAFVTKFPAVAVVPLPPPQLTQGAVVNGASFVAGAPVAPGSIISIFGSNLATSAVAAGSTPLPTGLLTISVTINGVRIPLYYVSPTQINAQVPFETPPGTATLAVTVNGALSPAVTFPVAFTAPGIFLYGSNRAVAVNLDGSLNASDHPAKPGDVIVVYMTGQGAVSNPIPSGASALGSPLSLALATTTATIGGTNAEVLFSGLAPGFVGLLQANIRIPNVAAGDRALVVTIGGAASPSALITVGIQ